MDCAFYFWIHTGKPIKLKSYSFHYICLQAARIEMQTTPIEWVFCLKKNKTQTPSSVFVPEPNLPWGAKHKPPNSGLIIGFLCKSSSKEAQPPSLAFTVWNSCRNWVHIYTDGHNQEKEIDFPSPQLRKNGKNDSPQILQTCFPFTIGHSLVKIVACNLKLCRLKFYTILYTPNNSNGITRNKVC